MAQKGMRHFSILLFPTLMFMLFAAGCAGFPLPFTEKRAFDLPIESTRTEKNSDCTSLTHLNSVAGAWELQHLKYIRTKDDAEAIPVESLVISLGPGCKDRWRNLAIPDIKTELFGDIQTIADSSKLRELGGVSFTMSDVSTMSGIEASLHLRTQKNGPDHRLVAIYRLEDDKVIHYNYSGTDDVDGKSRRWPIEEFFGALFGTAVKFVPGQ